MRATLSPDTKGSDMSSPIVTLSTITRINGAADTYAYRTMVTYDHGAHGSTSHYVAFEGSEHGAPVVMITEHGQSWVTDWRRFGDKLTPEWVRAFFGVTEQTDGTN